MRLFDLTHTITEDMPVYPGDDRPGLVRVNEISTDMFSQTRLIMGSHTGTHMDAPAHMIEGAPTLDLLPADCFAGSAAVVDCRGAAKDGRITAGRIRAAAGYSEAEFLLMYTGWDALWGSDGYFEGFPMLDESAVEIILRLKLKGVGTDAPSADPVDGLDNHRALLCAGLVIVENLTGLGALMGRRFDFFALPLKFLCADGAPVRAVAVVQ